MNLFIRPARVTDADVICEFNRLMARESEQKELDPATLKAGVAAMLADQAKGRYFVAEANPLPQPLSQGARGAVVGQLGYTCEWSDWRNGNFWWVQSVYVAESARRQGVFRRLFDHLLEAARQEPNVIGVRLYVEHDNRIAQETYRQLGLAKTGYHVMEKYPL
jgi:ribosomal protein S18 acetylase RimI-like enzyme